MGLYSVTAGSVPITALVGGALGSWIGLSATIGVAAVAMAGLLVWVLATGKLALVKYELAVPIRVTDDADPSATSLPAAPTGEG